MRSSLALVLSITLVACSGASEHSRCPTPAVREEGARATADSADSLGDLWVGGFDSADGAGAFVRVDFAAGIARLHPREERAPLGIIHPRLERDPGGRETVQFVVDDGKHRRTFDLRRTAPDVLEGRMTDEKKASSTARLARLATYDRKAVDAVLAGTYAVDGDPHQLLFVQDGRLFDTRDGSDRRLYLRSDGHALLGSGVATAYPSGGVVTIDASRTLRIEREGAAVSAPRFDLKSEETRFASSDGIVLQGTLLSPPSAGPHPAVVYVHGSGRSSRRDPWENAMARVMLAQGYAMFLYDKRGVGDSGGEYVGPGARDPINISVENLARLAADARAALAVLATRQDIDTTRLGFFGLSQAGWVVPLAAKGNKAARFVVLMSAASVHTSVALAYEYMVGQGESCMPIPDVDRVVHDHAPRTGLDPAVSIAALDVPGLWVYGGADVLIPFQECMRILEPMKRKHDFTVMLAPSAGHELYVVRRDSEDERQISTGLSPVALATLRTWLREHVGGERRPR